MTSSKRDKQSWNRKLLNYTNQGDKLCVMKNLDSAIPSNRKFGFFFSCVFSIAFAYFFRNSTSNWYLVFAVLAVLTLTITLFSPNKLQSFNKLWFMLGLLLGKIISPIVLGLIFFALITPVALLMRLAGRDELRLKMINRSSHWKKRTPVGPEPQTFKNQF